MQETRNTNPTPSSEDTFDAIRREYISEHEAGNAPTLEAFVARHPRYAGELTDFILDYLAVENAVAGDHIPDQAEAYRAGTDRAFAALGIERPAAPVETVELSTGTLREARTAKGWTFADMARRLHLPTGLLLKAERGQITDWPAKLTQTLADALAVPRAAAEQLLQATAGNFRQTAAAFSADGDPDVATANARRQETFTFADALAKEKLTPEQAAFWQAED